MVNRHAMAEGNTHGEEKHVAFESKGIRADAVLGNGFRVNIAEAFAETVGSREGGLDEACVKHGVIVNRLFSIINVQQVNIVIEHVTVVYDTIKPLLSMFVYISQERKTETEWRIDKGSYQLGVLVIKW